MEVIHVPSGGAQINGVVYVASGERPHPAFVFFHGLPGNEKNLDLAQAVRRAGWTVVTVNYRGSWGSPGKDHGKDWSFKTLAPELIHRNLLVLYGNDFVKPDSLELIKDVKAAGGTTIAEKYVVTDHSWSWSLLPADFLGSNRFISVLRGVRIYRDARAASRLL
jgi:pimeloyl-ACP methyl ester carboxylesterase